MCGIYSILSYYNKSLLINHATDSNSKKLSARGPDDYQYYKDEFIHMDFYRLAINGISNGKQPMCYKNYVLICNGEIYNHKELERLIEYIPITGSDCEVILPLFDMYGIEQTCILLDGVFAFVIWDTEKHILYSARDRFGVRPLFYSILDGVVQISSEMKGMDISMDMSVKQFPPGQYLTLSNYQFKIIPEFKTYYQYGWNENKLFKKNYCLVLQYLPVEKQLRTFSIGFEGSPDLKYARKVANYLKTDHHEFLVTPQEFLDNINEVIRVTETCDITTIRASVGNYLVCKKIKEYNQTQEKENQSIVIFNGDGADEVAGGYLYHRNAPSGLDFHLESVSLLKEIHNFDVLRSDRCCSDNGLEPRTPFLDRDFVNAYMSIPIQYRFDNTKQEKYLIREAFKEENIIPDEVLFRKKEAFSDGVSIKEKSWWQIIQEYLEDKVVVNEINKGYPFPTTGLTKESYYYYKKFADLYKNQIKVIPHYWLPKWSGNVINPSARVLTNYTD